MERGGAHRLTDPMVHSCGFESFYATGYAMHAKHCNGTRPATEGRIAARERDLAIATTTKKIGRPRKPVDDERTERRRDSYRKSSAKRHGNGHADPPAPIVAAPPGVASIAAAATDKAIEVTIAGLRARRAQIDTALAALEALA